MNLSLFFRNISLFLVLLFCYSCSGGYINYDAKLHNVPFIDASETAKLDFELSKDSVLNLLGDPLYVSKGTNDIQSIVWVYQVRTILTKGNIKEVSLRLKDSQWVLDFEKLLNIITYKTKMVFVNSAMSKNI